MAKPHNLQSDHQKSNKIRAQDVGKLRVFKKRIIDDEEVKTKKTSKRKSENEAS